jgi:hypothetical protein
MCVCMQCRWEPRNAGAQVQLHTQNKTLDSAHTHNQRTLLETLIRATTSRRRHKSGPGCASVDQYPPGHGCSPPACAHPRNNTHSTASYVKQPVRTSAGRHLWPPPPPPPARPAHTCMRECWRVSAGPSRCSPGCRPPRLAWWNPPTHSRCCLWQARWPSSLQMVAQSRRRKGDTCA